MEPQGQTEFTEQPEIENLNPHLIDEAYDILKKWGMIDDEGALFFNTSDLGANVEFVIAQSKLVPNINGILLYKSHLPRETELVKLKKDGEPLWCWWDKDLTADDVVEAIEKIDSNARELGLIDVETGKRRQTIAGVVPNEEARKRLKDIFIGGIKLKVDEYFRENDDAITISPYITTENEASVLNQYFDHAERLIVVRGDVVDGNHYVLTGKQLPFYTRRAEISRDVLKEMSIRPDTPLSPEERKRIQRIVMQRMNQR